jgi:hypothetical protein
MNGKIYPIADAFIVQDVDTGEKYVVRKEDSDLPYVVGSDVVYSIDKDGFVIINKCETIAEIHNINNGWICPRCNRANAPFVTNCDC